jgi:transposase
MSTDAPSPRAPLAVDPALLPDDAAVLKELVAQLMQEIQKRDGRVERLEHQLTLLLRRMYGIKSEKLDPRQALLFGAAAAEDAIVAEPASVAVADEAKERTPGRRAGAHGRRRLPDTLQRREVLHDLTPAEKESLGGEENIELIGREVTEQLEWEPSTLFVIQHVQLTYARKKLLAESGSGIEQQNVVTAAKPPQAIPGCLAGPGLLAHVITSKACDHLPWHRMERIFARHGLEISRQTMCGWSLAAADALRPLYELMKSVVLASRVIHHDDTPVDLRDAYKKLKQRAYFWAAIGDEEHPLIVFDFTMSHSSAGPVAFLEPFRGYLQADAASVYHPLYVPGRGIIEVACWMHARRRFFDARDKDRLRAQTALAWIAKLYDVERELKAKVEGQWHELSRDARYAVIAAERQARSVPLLNDFYAWLLAEAPKVLPKHPVRDAMDYALSNWQALCRYTEDGALDIDNGEAERAIRSIALGRKNWLFCASQRGGEAAAIHFSFVANCRRHNVDPFAYLRDVLTRLPRLGETPASDELRELLPDRWQPAPSPASL